jgi:fluoride ion exporter CrcB/FEX
MLYLVASLVVGLIAVALGSMTARSLP